MLDTIGNKIRTKEEIRSILAHGHEEEFSNLWEGAYMDEHYKQYEVTCGSEKLNKEFSLGERKTVHEGYSMRQMWEDGSWHTYEAVYSLNDGKISNKMKEFLDKNIHMFHLPMWIYTNSDGDEQAFFIMHNGSNGVDGNALNSMKEACDYLEKLQTKVEWATLLGAYCDTCDDVYGWYFTFIL